MVDLSIWSQYNKFGVIFSILNLIKGKGENLSKYIKIEDKKSNES
jgi:hypothetical protein